MSGEHFTHIDDLEVDESFEYGTRKGASDFFKSESIQFSVITFDPGEGGPVHYHNPPIEEYYLVLDGHLDIMVDGETRKAGPGTITYQPPGAEQQPMNNYDEPATILAASAPPAIPHAERTVRVNE